MKMTENLAERIGEIAAEMYEQAAKEDEGAYKEDIEMIIDLLRTTAFLKIESENVGVMTNTLTEVLPEHRRNQIDRVKIAEKIYTASIRGACRFIQMAAIVLKTAKTFSKEVKNEKL